MRFSEYTVVVVQRIHELQRHFFESSSKFEVGYHDGCCSGAQVKLLNPAAGTVTIARVAMDSHRVMSVSSLESPSVSIDGKQSPLRRCVWAHPGKSRSPCAVHCSAGLLELHFKGRLDDRVRSVQTGRGAFAERVLPMDCEHKLATTPRYPLFDPSFWNRRRNPCRTAIPLCSGT